MSVETRSKRGKKQKKCENVASFWKFMTLIIFTIINLFFVPLALIPIRFLFDSIP